MESGSMVPRQVIVIFNLVNFTFEDGERELF